MAEKRISPFAPVRGCNPARPGAKIAMLLTAAVMSGAAMAGFGGVLFICAAAGILAYVMCTGTNIAALPLCGALSFGFAMLLGVEWYIALITLVYVPMAIVIWLSVKNRQSLSQTVLYLTLLLILIGGATVGVLYLKDSSWTTELFGSLYNAYKEYVTVNLAAIAKGYPVNAIDSLVYTTIMMIPGSVTVLIMGFGYLSAKIFRLASIVHDSSAMFDFYRWPVTASLPLTLICTVSTVMAVSVSDTAVNLLATNLMILTMPACFIYGINLIFSRNSRFRQSRMGRISLVLLCFMAFYSAGAVLLFFAPLYAFYNNMRIFIFSKFKKKD